MKSVKETHIVTKSNILNEMRSQGMTIIQARLFSIYLARINPKDKATREVQFSLDEYIKIMGFVKADMTRIQESAKGLLRMIVTVYPEDTDSKKSRVEYVQLFKRFSIYKDELGKWMVSIDCHDDLLDKIFDLKKHYFRYRLWNIVYLSTYNQYRIYELLKQYEKAGERTIPRDELREYLQIKKGEYKSFNNFKVRVLDSCKEALRLNTDICYDYVMEKAGRGGKVVAIKFIIKKNKPVNQNAQLSLEEYMEMQLQGEPEVDGNMELEEFTSYYTPEEEAEREREKICDGFGDPVFAEYTLAQLQEMYDLARGNVPREMIEPHIAAVGNVEFATRWATAEYIKQKINKAKTTTGLKNQYAYIKAAIQHDYK